MLAAKGIKTNYYIGGGSQVLEDYYPELNGKKRPHPDLTARSKKVARCKYRTQEINLNLRTFIGSS
jgi:hypothetical protein